VIAATTTAAWEQEDRYRTPTLLAFGMLGAAAVFAQLGLPPLPLHEPTHYAGIMAPSCGLTRGVVAIARGAPSAAWRYNPASFLVFTLGLALVVRAAAGWITGRWLRISVHLTPLSWIILAAAAIALEINQQMHVELLR
jgi:Protein of unknown function (DUF2752)